MNARIFSALALCLLGLFAVCAWAQEKSDAATIRTLEEKWVDAHKQRQITTVASLLADDYVINLEDGSTYGKVGFISHNAGSLRVDIAEVSDLKVRLHDNIPVLTAHITKRACLAANHTTITTA